MKTYGILLTVTADNAPILQAISRGFNRVPAIRHETGIHTTVLEIRLFKRLGYVCKDGNGYNLTEAGKVMLLAFYQQQKLADIVKRNWYFVDKFLKNQHETETDV